MHIRRRVPIRSLVAVSALGLVLAACASANDAPDSSTVESTTTPTPSTTSTTLAPTTTSKPAVLVSITPNVGELQAIILVDADGRLPEDTMIEGRCGAIFPTSALDDVRLLTESRRKGPGFQRSPLV